MIDEHELERRIQTVQQKVAAAASQAGRSPGDVTIVGVTKNHPAELVALAYNNGLRHFGENRVQEAQEKVAVLRSRMPEATWHLIGHLQSNKVRTATEIFTTIQSVDSMRIAEEINRRAKKQQAVLLQVNISGERSKFGFVAPGFTDVPGESLLDALDSIRALPNIEVRGLMTIAPLIANMQQSQDAARRCFIGLRELRDRLRAEEGIPNCIQLSMGMTDDYEIAIEEGSTLVRIGRALFGSRQL